MDSTRKTVAVVLVSIVVGGLVAGATATGLSIAVVLAALQEEDPESVASELESRISAGEITWTFDASDPVIQQRRIVVTTEINELASKYVVSALLYLDGVAPGVPIDLLLESPGGWSFDGAAIIDTIELIESPVNTWAIGYCGSAATEILASGTGMRYAGASAIIMVHILDYEEASKVHSADWANSSRDVRFWETHADLPDGWLTAGEEWYYLTTDEAIKMGIIDVVAIREHATEE